AEANQYCRSLGTEPFITSATQTEPPYVFGNFLRIEIEFRCASPSATAEAAILECKIMERAGTAIVLGRACFSAAVEDYNSVSAPAAAERSRSSKLARTGAINSTLGQLRNEPVQPAAFHPSGRSVRSVCFCPPSRSSRSDVRRSARTSLHQRQPSGFRTL